MWRAIRRSGLGSCVALALVVTHAADSFADSRAVVVEEHARIVPPGPDDIIVGRVALSGPYLLTTTHRNFYSPEGFRSEQFAYLYRRRDDGTWAYEATLASTSTPHESAPPMTIAMQGNIAAVNVDELRIFERTSAGWQQVATLPSFESVDMEIDDGRILVGGAACRWSVFAKGPQGWSTIGFAGRSSECWPTEHFQDVDISGSRVVVANPYYGLPSGVQWPHRVRIHERLAALPPFTIVTDPLEGSPGLYSPLVAIDGDTVFVSRSGAAVALEKSVDGLWRLQARLEPPDATLFDASVLVPMGGLIALGVGFDALRGNGAGSVRVFLKEGGTYREAARLVASGAGEEEVGRDVAIDGRYVAAAGLRAVYVFRLPSELRAPTLVQDDFEDGDAAGWTPSLSSWRIVGDKANKRYRQQHLTAANVKSVLGRYLWANQSVEADVTPLQFAAKDRWFGVITRYTNAENYYYLSVRNTNRVLLRRKRNNIITTLDSASLEVSANRTYRLRIEAIGTRLRGYVDDELLVEAVDRTMRDGRPGLITFGVRADFDNLVATPSPLTRLFHDTFDGQFVSEYWQTHSGTWEHIHDSDPTTGEDLRRYAQTSSGAFGRAIAGFHVSDQVVEASMRSTELGQDESCGLIARYAGDGNYYYFGIGGNGEAALWTVFNGSPFKLAAAPFSVAPNTWSRLRLEVLGNALRAYADGQLLIQARDETHQSGRYGLATFQTSAEFDDVIVSQP